MEYRIEYLSSEVGPENVWGHVETKLHLYVNEYMKDMVDSILNQLSNKLNLSNLLTDHLEQSNLTQKDRVRRAFTIIQSTEIMTSGAISLALEVLLNLDGNPQLSEMIRNVIRKEFQGNVEVKPWFKWRQTIPPKPAYYIQRTISPRTRLTDNFLKKVEGSKNIFVFSGIGWSQLSSLVPGKMTDRSSCQTRRVTVEFIMLEDESDFESISTTAKGDGKDVHWIRKDGDTFHWVKSSGNVRLLHGCIHPDQNRFSEEEFIAKLMEDGDSRAVCLADNPGMGKTVLLANLAKELETKCPSKFVFFFVLREAIPLLVKVEDEDYLLSLVLGCVDTKTTDERIQVRSILAEEMKSYSFELFFDGFDEVLSDQVDICERLFQSLLKSPDCRVHVTTRLHMLDELESAVGVLGHNILPFGPDEQKEFLRKCWVEEHKALDTDHLSSFADECLNNIKSRMTDGECDIAGIPLQCWMLADVYSREAVKYSKGESKYGINVEVASIFDLYKKLFQTKFSRVIELFKPEDPSILEVLKECHVLAAFLLLFPDFLEIIDMVSKVKLTDEEVKMVYSVGLMEPNLGSDTPRFLHRTFAEALIAEYLVQGLPTKNHHCNKDSRRNLFLYRNILHGLENHEYKIYFPYYWSTTISSFRFQHQVINYFIDRNLQGVVGTVQYDQLNEDAQFTPHEEVLIPCATNNFVNIFDFILKFLQCFHVPPHDPSDLCLITAAHSRDWTMMRKVTDHAGDISKIKKRVYRMNFTPLHAAVRAGSFTVSQYLFGFYQDNIPAGLLHCCIAGSSEDPEAVVNEKLEIIKMIVGEKKAILGKEWEGEDRPPILCLDAHYRLLECLITLGADVNAVNEKSQSVLHRLNLEIMTASSFTRFCNLLLSREFHRWGEAENDNHWTPLHRALVFIEADRPLLTFFKERGLDFNPRDEYGKSVLHEAVESGRSVDYIKLLCEFGSDVWSKNDEEQNALHLALEWRRFEILRYFVTRSDCKEHINEADQWGDTLLHFAVKRNIPEGVKLLLEGGADLNAKNRYGMIPLMLALNDQNLPLPAKVSIVTEMEKSGWEIVEYLPHLLHFLLLSKYDWYEAKESFGDLLIRCLEALESFCKSKNINYSLPQNSKSNENLHALAVYLDAVVKPHEHDEYTKVLEGFKLEEAKMSNLPPHHIPLVKELCESFQEGKKYSTPPPGVSSFINSRNQLLVIKTFNSDLCLQRLTEWFPSPHQAPKHESDLRSISKWKNGSLRSSDGVHILEGKELDKKCLPVLTNGKKNVMITTSNISEESRRLLPENHQIVEDTLEWNDISLSHQYRIAYRLLFVRDESIFHFCRTSELRFCSGLQNHELGRLVSNLEEKYDFSVELEDSISVIVRGLEEQIVLYLENSVFQQILPPKLQNTPEVMSKIKVSQETKEKLVRTGILEKAEPHPVFRNGALAWYFVTRKILGDGVSPDNPYSFSINQFMKEIGSCRKECTCDAFLHYPQDLVLFYLDHFAETKMYISQIKSIFSEDSVFSEAACRHKAQNLLTLLADNEDNVWCSLNLIARCLKNEGISKIFTDSVEIVSRVRPAFVAEGISSYLLTKPEGERMSCMKLILRRLEDVLKETGAGVKLVKALANAGLTQCLHARNWFDETIIHLILFGQDPDPTFFKILKEAGFDFNLENGFGETLLFVAIRCKRSVEVIKALVENGADFSRRNKYNGYTLIHHAIDRHAEKNTEYCEIVLQYLMTLGLDVNAKDNAGRTPLDLLESFKFRNKTEENEKIRMILQSSSTD